MKLLCDEMLKGLGRWLRAAGYDTAIAENGVADREVWARACREDRLLITRDRKFREYRDSDQRVLCLGNGRLSDHIRQLSALLPIDWQYRPFSRCLLCNTPLQSAAPGLAARVPPRARPDATPLYYCPQCDKVYWSGGHVKRMQARLCRWQRGDYGPQAES